MKSRVFVGFFAACGLVGGFAFAQQPPQAPPAGDASEALVMADAVPADLIPSAVAAVTKLGDEVVMGRYQVAVERMNPLWKERMSNYMPGGKEALERKLAEVAAQMVQQGISMISFKPQGQPRVYQVAPGKRGAAGAEKLVYTKWLVLVPTVTKFRLMRNEEGGAPKVVMIESTGYQVAISDKGNYNWTFIDGSGLKVSDLRALFGTLPLQMELPPVGKREAK